MDPLESKKSRVVVVTGGTAGVGRATALRFAEEGWRVGVIARDAVAVERTVSDLEVRAPAAFGFSADVADPVAVEAAANGAVEALGPIDVWVNNAMTTVFFFFEDVTPEEYRRVTDVCYLGVVYGTLAALRRMEGRGGAIVQVGSALAYRGIPLQTAYCGAKHAIRGFTDSLRSEAIYKKTPVRISIVELPAVNTPQFDWGRTHMQRRPRPASEVIFQPEAAADAVFRAALEGHREYWLGLVTAKTIIANMIMPGGLDHLLARYAVDGQQTDELARADRPDNLFSPVTELHSTHGAFGAGAKMSGILVTGRFVRLAVISVGAALCIAFGALLTLLI